MPARHREGRKDNAPSAAARGGLDGCYRQTLRVLRVPMALPAAAIEATKAACSDEKGCAWSVITQLSSTRWCWSQQPIAT
ncbi:hypothetical protein DF3PA_40143 [Candidatus Defluviicoccus seviourii]|uniref:Uncharacterized protein n=2 Tax=root TaxID=1 RepID=A0A564WFI9_9PROT|nr:hypothetical protein DF3PB_2900005 [uncultured Defluviicoccus sp.]SUS08545.1 hypothetical protein DF3PB_730010 [uncultured Defluviicoccus sp.]VUX47267.1 hypothetical protein DF3PA_40143 [Candidatus Defluviicoccus seviourii]